MKIFAKAIGTTKASPEVIFQLWADVEHWGQWDKSIEWIKLEDAFAINGHYTLKPKGGPNTKATITSVTINQSFRDVSSLPGAKLIFDHVLTAAGITTVTHTATMSGPLSWLWTTLLGKKIGAGMQSEVENLIKLAEEKP